MAIRTPKQINRIGPRMARKNEALSAAMAKLLVGARVRSGKGDPLVKHVGAKSDQRQRPIANDLRVPDDIEIIEQEQNADRDQNYGPGGKHPARAAQRNQTRKFVNALSHLALAGGVICLESHVENPDPNQHSKHRRKSTVRIGTDDADEKAENDHVQQALHVLAVVNG